jgi:aryl-alcohol dehydrogenase-like predicted oxidoreductase
MASGYLGRSADTPAEGKDGKVQCCAIESRNTATYTGTRRFSRRFPTADKTHFRHVRGLTIGSIGIGTYLGSKSPRVDHKARAAIISAVVNGCNLIDTARNYRGGRSEIVVGGAIRAISAAGIAERNELIVCSKAGYILEQNACARQFSASTVDANVLSPAFLSSEIALSLERTGLDAIDIYLLHNPELHLPKLGKRKFYRTLTSCFEILERHVHDKKLGMYGLACWSAFGKNAPMLIDISKVMRGARVAGGNTRNNFGAIETPLNWVYRNPVVAPAQRSLSKVCRENNLILIGSSALLGGQLVRLPSELGTSIPGMLSDAQRSIQFARSIPGVSATLVGMTHKNHIEDNLRLRQIPMLRKSLVQRLISALDTV